ncbi:serine/threonine-protein kinase [Salinigranum halophilum]|uniref:serine/threonine-protein kinase n=1 Tax=Salinigranum halophilum TaxID=2565931 RepID=UPI00191C3622|nr:serine/threonine-protein kinase [Salinigranum halophilum]
MEPLSLTYDDLCVEEPIDSGRNPDVQRATVSTPEGEVTLAVKPPGLRETIHADRVERLLSEASTWDRLDNHYHVIGVVDWGPKPFPWIAMEFMDCGDLGVRAGTLPQSQALWTAIAVTEGVHHAHRRGVAHLDLKPANVLFRLVDGAWDVPKVGDWGLSKHLLDHSASVEGLSVEYAAPEQFDSAYGPADDLTDVYQLGAVFYELFTGRPPFEESPAAVMRAVLEETPTPPSEHADLPSDIDDILLRSLAKERTDRYESVLYLRDQLRTLYEQSRPVV